MGLVFVSSTPIPATVADFDGAYWYAVWDRPVPSPHDLLPGGTVYLADEAGTIVWETTVTDMVAIPYESSEMLREYLAKRWGLRASPINGNDPCPGYCMAWRAEPVERLDLVVPEGLEPLETWASTRHLDEAERTLRGLRDEGPCPVC